MGGFLEGRGYCLIDGGQAAPLLEFWKPLGPPLVRPGAIAQSPDREAALAWASLVQHSPASSLLAREGAGCGSVGDVPGAWLASAPLWRSLWT